jgi:hypothetical protein
MQNTAEKQYSKDGKLTMRHLGSGSKHPNESEFGDFGRRSKYSKTKLSHQNPINPYLGAGHNRTSSGGMVDPTHHRQPSEPLSIIYYNQSQS